MKLIGAAFVAVIALMLLACGGSGSTSSTGPAAATPAAPQPGAGGLRIALSMDGGPHVGDYNLTHTNPCQYNLPSDGDWRTTVTFPGATSGPTIVDLELTDNESFVDAWFGDDQFHAPDVEFTVDNRGETATLMASGNMTGPDGTGPSFPVQITVECDRVAIY